jgi:hypothetical protein
LPRASLQAYADVTALQPQLAGSAELQGELDSLRSFLEQLASSHDAASSGGSRGRGSRGTSAVDVLGEQTEEAN